jgi:hypothetical protein
MRVPEFVPEVPRLPRFPVRSLEVTPISPCGFNRPLEHRQMGGVRLMKAGYQTVDRTDRPIWRDHEIGPPLTC